MTIEIKCSPKGEKVNLKPEERLIVIADFKPDVPRREWVKQQVLALADELEGTGICLMVSSALRACGYDLIHQIHARSLKVFADLKLFDVRSTLATDGALLKEVSPEHLTVACLAGTSAMHTLKIELPGTEILGVTVLPGIPEEETRAMFTCSTEEAMLRLAQVAVDAKINSVLSPPKELVALRAKFGVFMSIHLPAIRPAWSIIPGDYRYPAAEIMTPSKAILAGADRVVVGGPITSSRSPHDAVMRTLDEIAAATV